MALKFTYPSDIEQDKYQYRHLKIFVKESEISANAKAAWDSAMEKFNTATKAVTESPEAKNAAEMSANLKENSKADDSPTNAIIVLPLPNTFQDSQNHGWTEETGIIGSMGKNITGMTPGGLASKLKPNEPPKTKGKDQPQPGMLSKLAEEASGGITIDKVLGSSASAMGMRKPLIDPGYFQNYTGSAPREFTMQWDLVPSSAAEANQIFMIIMKLKEYSSPTSTVKGVSLLAPYFFALEFGNPYITAMAKIDRVVIKNITVDYGADGFMQQTYDGMPKHMTLSLSFAEVDMSTANDYRRQK